MKPAYFLCAIVGSAFHGATAYMTSRSGGLNENRLGERNLQTRQAPAVIATSQFLRRAFQASAVAGSWLYIDGGEFSFNNGGPSYQYSSTILAIDLSQDWVNSTVPFHSTAKPQGAPNLNNPSLWYDQKDDLLYSGFTGYSSYFGDTPALPPLSLWSFKPDGAGSGAWNEAIGPTDSIWKPLTRPSGALMAYGSNNAFVLGGFDNPQSNDPFVNTEIPGLISFDMGSKTFTNLSATAYNQNATAANGAMQYVPAFGPNGLFVAMGGITTNGTLIDFTNVTVFDPATRKWYNQTTTGSQPSPRIEFCTAGVSSTNGTFEIFVYAGWGTELGSPAIPFDTVNILTLPAFHWISVPYNPQKPRLGHSCNAVGGSQIVSIGGLDGNPQLTSGDVGAIYQSTFNSTADPFSQGLAIFDMSSLSFADHYSANAPPYKQSSPIKDFYSNSNQSYEQGLTPGVANLLKVTHFTSTSANSTANGTATAPPASTTSSTPAKTNAGAIAGGVVGGVAFVAAVAGLVLFLLARRRKKYRTEGNTQDSAEKWLPSGYGNAHTLHELPQDAKPVEIQDSGYRDEEVHEMPNNPRPGQGYQAYKPAELSQGNVSSS